MLKFVIFFLHPSFSYIIYISITFLKSIFNQQQKYSSINKWILRQTLFHSFMKTMLQSINLPTSFIKDALAIRKISYQNQKFPVAWKFLVFFPKVSRETLVLESALWPVWQSPLSLIDYPFSSQNALFQTSTLQSDPPVAKKSPFLEKAEALISPLWPYIV